jgi:hypothetical protein
MCAPHGRHAEFFIRISRNLRLRQKDAEGKTI